MAKKLYRSRSDRMIWGVCGGLAEYFDIDPTVVRVIVVLLTVVSGIAPGILIYIVLTVVVPLENSSSREPKDVIRENVEEMKQTASRLSDGIRSTFAREEGTPEETAKTQHHGRNVLGIILIVIGIIFLVASLKPFWWLRWSYLWPLILIAIGLLIILGARRK